MESIDYMFGNPNKEYFGVNSNSTQRPIFLQNIIDDIEKNSMKMDYSRKDNTLSPPYQHGVFYVPETYDTTDGHLVKSGESYSGTKTPGIEGDGTDYSIHHPAEWGE